MLIQNASDDILINGGTEGQIDLFGDMWATPGRIAVSFRDLDELRGIEKLMGSVP